MTPGSDFLNFVFSSNFMRIPSVTIIIRVTDAATATACTHECEWKVATVNKSHKTKLFYSIILDS